VRAASRRITNPPQVTNLPHMAARRKLGIGKIVAAREDLNGSSTQMLAAGLPCMAGIVAARDEENG